MWVLCQGGLILGYAVIGISVIHSGICMVPAETVLFSQLCSGGVGWGTPKASRGSLPCIAPREHGPGKQFFSPSAAPTHWPDRCHWKN